MYATVVGQKDDLQTDEQRIRIPQAGIAAIIKVVRIESLGGEEEYGVGPRIIMPPLIKGSHRWFDPITTVVGQKDDLQTDEQRIRIPQAGIAAIIKVVRLEPLGGEEKYGGGDKTDRTNSNNSSK